MELYHGSNLIVEKPVFGGGNLRNDYGLGLYCTKEPDLAKEWACASEDNGFANHYAIDDKGLSTLYLNDGQYNILNWLAILLENRTFDLSTPLSVQGKKYLLDNFLPDYKGYDIITGYRADDSYFSFSKAFLANGITLEQLKRAMKPGKLGEQVVIKSKEAFERMYFIKAEPVDASIYYPKRMYRDRTARQDYRTILQESPASDAVFLSDILKEKWSNDDARL
ncbi:MAG: DUF3990 domain-containing protein [Bacteroidales bacterium]|nr:DUF3990 domain-containing protein [Bacteroidales bacterium]